MMSSNNRYPCVLLVSLFFSVFFCAGFLELAQCSTFFAQAKKNTILTIISESLFLAFQSRLFGAASIAVEVLHSVATLFQQIEAYLIPHISPTMSQLISNLILGVLHVSKLTMMQFISELIIGLYMLNVSFLKFLFKEGIRELLTGIFPVSMFPYFQAFNVYLANIIDHHEHLLFMSVYNPIMGKYVCLLFGFFAKTIVGFVPFLLAPHLLMLLLNATYFIPQPGKLIVRCVFLFQRRSRRIRPDGPMRVTGLSLCSFQNMQADTIACLLISSTWLCSVGCWSFLKGILFCIDKRVLIIHFWAWNAISNKMMHAINGNIRFSLSPQEVVGFRTMGEKIAAMRVRSTLNSPFFYR